MIYLFIHNELPRNLYPHNLCHNSCNFPTSDPPSPLSMLAITNYMSKQCDIQREEWGFPENLMRAVDFEVLSSCGEEQRLLRCEPLSLCTEITSASIYI